MDDKVEMEKLQSPTHIAALTIHDAVCSTLAWLWSPVSIFLEHVNGTTELREWLQKTEDMENFNQIVTNLDV